MGKQEDKQKIFDAVNEYYKRYHANDTVYKKGGQIAYAKRVYDEKEMINLVDAALDFWLTSGEYTKAFEEGLTNKLGLKYASFVNSGSSANFLALASLMSPLLKERRLERGDEVITVAAGFPTTINPILQNGLIPVFVDIEIPTYNIDVSLLDEAYSSKVKAVMIAHTLGNPFDIDAVKDFCDRHGLWLIEDNCDALGSKYNGKFTGTFGDIATSSFYPAHHITTGEGGAVYTDDPLLHKIVVSLRDWGRDCECAPGQDNSCGHRFDGIHGTLPSGYDHKYVYSHAGYNLKATDMQAAVGVAQLEKLESFVEKRKENFKYLDKKIKDLGLEKNLILPVATEKSEPGWFGYLITVKENANRNETIRYIEDAGIQTRMLFGGNITRQPYFMHLKEGMDYRIAGALKNTDEVMERSFWLGLYPEMNKEMMDYMAKTLAKAIKKGA